MFTTDFPEKKKLTFPVTILKDKRLLYKRETKKIL